MNQDEAIQKVIHYHCPRYSELPDMALYLEQLLSFAHKATSAVIPESPTGPMVNNYVKQSALPAAQRKKYSKEHLCYLIVITLLKDVFTLPQLAKFFDIQRKTYPLETAYNFFCQEYENALKESFLFTGNPLPCIETKRTDQTILIRAIVLAAANRVFVEKTYFGVR